MNDGDFEIKVLGVRGQIDIPLDNPAASSPSVQL